MEINRSGDLGDIADLGDQAREGGFTLSERKRL
jgi:hypothetical protein